MRVKFLRYLDTRQKAENIHKLVADFHVQVFDDKVAYAIIVPKGFFTDFASVPRLPFAYLLYGGLGNRSAVVHDALYSCWDGIICVNLKDGKPYPYTRKWADKVFLAGLETCGISLLKRRAMYRAVRLFGGSIFSKNKGRSHKK